LRHAKPLVSFDLAQCDYLKDPASFRCVPADQQWIEAALE